MFSRPCYVCRVISLRALRTPSVSGPLASRSRMAAAWCRTHRPCALCAFPFPSIRSALYPAPLSPYRTPLISPSLSFLLLVTRPPHACLVERTRPPLLSFISPSTARAGSTPCFRPYLHSMHRLCIPSPPHPPPVCCFPLSVCIYKTPWSSLFFFIHLPLTFTAELRNSFDVVKLDSSV